MQTRALYSTLCLVLLSTLAHANGSGTEGTLTLPSQPQALFNGQGESAQWTGVGRLSWQNRLCIGTLLDTRDTPANASGPAYMLTAGHCTGGENGKILADQPASGSVAFNYFTDTTQQRHTVALKRTIWNSLQGTDLALLELDTTLADLLAKGITPLKLGASPASGREVQVVGEPASAGKGLRLSQCTEHYQAIDSVDNRVMRHVRRNDCKGIDAGASGSPVVDPATGRLVSVVTSLHDTAVGAVPVQRVQGCFTGGKADLDAQDCQLSPSFQLVQRQDSAFKTLTKARTLADGSLEQPTWRFGFLIDTPRYRYKLTRDALACEDPTGYSGTIDSSEAVIDDPIGPEPGRHYLCIVGVQSPEQLSSPALMANSLTVMTELLPPGRPQAQVTTEPLADGSIRVTWLKAPDVVFYRVKRGAPELTDCDDHAGYRLLPGNQRVIPASQLPLKICSVAIDLLRQSSTFHTDLLQVTAP
ncbi:TPA: trypsin-like peptidase domain-containing protein [Pseudomonas putida]|nr:trypsin-like peptidase domain-containing protein [Pseudomonas putida]